jgi:two-component system OmpR family sensor kinase
VSIYNKIRIIFAVSLFFVTAFFASTLYIEHSKQIEEIEKKYVRTSLFLLKQLRHNRHLMDLSDTTLTYFLKESKFTYIDDQHKIQQIFEHAKVLKKRKVLRATMQILQDKKRRYLLLKHRKFNLLLEDGEAFEPPMRLFFGFLATLVFLGGLYLWLTRSLRPLQTLQDKIKLVSEGDLTVSFRSELKDEVAQVSNAFDDALRKLESLINSRQLFLRTIMHELKTPLGKGKILNSFVKDIDLKDGFDAVFHRLELLLNEFAKIEQMLSANYEVQLANYNGLELVDHALDLMILDDEVIQESVHIIEKEPLVLSTDFTLMTLALKNLIDNALKYGDDGKVTIVIENDGVTIQSKGTVFTNDIEEYYTPFHGQAHGMGLGLYIVRSSLEILGLMLEYKNQHGINNFKVLQSH